jgi:tRNA synthetases class I (I, L, M and V)
MTLERYRCCRNMHCFYKIASVCRRRQAGICCTPCRRYVTCCTVDTFTFSMHLLFICIDCYHLCCVQYVYYFNNCYCCRYVRCDSMAAQAVAEVREGRLKIEPPVHEKTWYRWLENARDWCVSRQVKLCNICIYIHTYIPVLYSVYIGCTGACRSAQ